MAELEGNTMSNIARALQGFGAGVAGQGQQFLKGLDSQRKMAMLQDAQRVQDLLRTGDVSGARDLLLNRANAVNQLGGDPSDTLNTLGKIDSGNVAGALNDATVLTEFGYQSGFLTRPTPAQAAKRDTTIANGKLIDKQTGEVIKDFGPDKGKDFDRTLREREIAIQEAREKRMTEKLSSPLENALLTAQDRTVEANRNANQYMVLADDFERLITEGGVKAGFSETMKGILGTQDDVTEFRRQFNKVRLSEGLRNLPPGPATDRDVKEAFKGVPKETASPEQVASFLRGAARLARFEAGYNQFKADFISNKSTAKGLNRAWRQRFESPRLKRKISMAEIYEAAQNRQIPPEQVAKDFGVEWLFTND